MTRPPRDRFERMMRDCDDAEASLRVALGIFDDAIDMSRRLPWPFRPIMIWIGRKKRRRAERHMLRLETARARLIGREAELRAMPADPGPWERPRG